MKPKDLEELLQQLSKLFTEHAKRAKSNIKNVLLPPATDAEISSYEKKTGVLFPESYRCFLRLHNGWRNFGNDYVLTGVSGPHTTKALREFQKIDKSFVSKWKTAGYSTEASDLKKLESGPHRGDTLEKARLYLPSQVKFGTNFASGLYVFNTTTADEHGEPEVLRTYFASKILRRETNFYAFLERTLADYKASM